MSTVEFKQRLTLGTVDKMNLDAVHDALHAESGQPQQVVETIGLRHDGPVGETLAHPEFILVQDRANGKIERLDRYKSERQSFVIRLKENVHLVAPRALQRQKIEHSPVLNDITHTPMPV